MVFVSHFFVFLHFDNKKTMRHQKSFFFLIMTLFVAATFVACGGRETIANATDSAVIDTEAVVDTTADGPLFECSVTDDGVFITATEQAEPQVEKETKPAAKKSAPSYGGKETLYISTYGANGKVWGHVTMNGNTGRGTIHDEDENSYSINVTRYGGELHGTDQNGRLYVFKL